MRFIEIAIALILWFGVTIAIEKLLPAIMEDYQKSKRLISVSSGLIGLFVVAIIFGVISVF